LQVVFDCAQSHVGDGELPHSATLSTEVVITKSILGMKKAALTKNWVTVHAHFDRAGQ
jgi:hypothetical protein